MLIIQGVTPLTSGLFFVIKKVEEVISRIYGGLQIQPL